MFKCRCAYIYVADSHVTISTTHRMASEDVWGNDDIPEEILEECEIMASQALMNTVEQGNIGEPPQLSRMPTGLTHGSSTAARRDNFTGAVRNYSLDNLTGSTSAFSDSGRDYANKMSHLESVDVKQNKLHAQIIEQQNEIVQLKQQQSLKEGEIKILRENLKKLKSEISDVRETNLQMLNKQSHEWKEKEQQLLHEVDRLKTQLHFKDQECVVLKSKLRSVDLAQKVPVAGTPQHHVGSKRKLPSEDTDSSMVAPHDRGDNQGSHLNFPSSHSFHAQNPRGIAGTRKPTKSTGIQVNTLENSEDSMNATCPAQIKRNKHRVNIFASDMHKSCGVVWQLMQAHPDMSQEHGVIGMLFSQKSQQNDIGADVEKQTSANVNCKALDISAKREATSDTCSLAKEALTRLMDHECRSSSVQQEFSTVMCTERSAILLLPRIEQQLADCINHIQAGILCVQNSLQVISSSSESGSSSLGKSSSLESGADSLNVLQVDAQEEDNVLDGVNPLTVLNTLILCNSQVGQYILQGSVESFSESDKSSTQKTTADKAEPVASSLQISDEELDLDLMNNYKVALLPKLMLLSEPQIVGGEVLYPRIVEAALVVLQSLALSAGDQHIDRLQGMIVNGVLSACLNVDNISIIAYALQVVRALATSRSMLVLMCTQTDSCLLHLVYSLCMNITEEMEATGLPTTITIVLSGIVFSHKDSAKLLLHTDCRCSLEIAPAVILLLHHVYMRYRQLGSNQDASFLKTGFNLLSSLYNCDPSIYNEFCLDDHVQSQFKTLAPAISKILSSSAEMETVQELFWDSDDDALSDSEQQSVSMDTT